MKLRNFLILEKKQEINGMLLDRRLCNVWFTKCANIKQRREINLCQNTCRKTSQQWHSFKVLWLHLKVVENLPSLLTVKLRSFSQSACTLLFCTVESEKVTSAIYFSCRLKITHTPKWPEVRLWYTVELIKLFLCHHLLPWFSRIVSEECVLKHCWKPLDWSNFRGSKQNMPWD